MITISADDVYRFQAEMEAAPGRVEAEFGKATAALTTEGMGLAIENAPVDNGDLMGSIAILELSPFEGEYGIRDLEYAWMREEGGTIRPRNGEFLVFEIDGRLIFAREVTQSGTKYMERSADSLEPQIEPAYAAALDRALGGIGG